MHAQTARHSRCTSVCIAVSPLFAAVLALALAVSPASAGLGKLVKDRAVQALQKPAAPAAHAGQDVEFTDELLELNEARVTGVLAAMRAGQSATPDRAPMLARRTRMQDEIGRLGNTYGRAIDAAREKHDRSSACWREQLEQLTAGREEAMQKQLMADPAMRQKFTALAMQMGQAQAKGDTAAVRALQAEMAAQVGATHADSLQARQRCGEPAPLHPMSVRIDSLQSAVAEIDHRLHEADEQALDAQLGASGQTGPQLAMSKERILLYLAAVKSKQAPAGFTAAELKVLDAHRAELLAAFAAYMD